MPAFWEPNGMSWLTRQPPFMTASYVLIGVLFNAQNIDNVLRLRGTVSATDSFTNFTKRISHGNSVVTYFGWSRPSAYGGLWHLRKHQNG